MTAIDAVKHRSLLRDFPRLRRRLYRGTSEPATNYNCFAWAVGETHRRWDPTRLRSARNYWPTESRSMGLAEALEAFEAVGFRRVDAARAVAGWQTITLYAADGQITHAARLLPSGLWTSKLGDDIDLEHETPEALGGGLYGEPSVTLKRPLETTSTG